MRDNWLKNFPLFKTPFPTLRTLSSLLVIFLIIITIFFILRFYSNILSLRFFRRLKENRYMLTLLLRNSWAAIIFFSNSTVCKFEFSTSLKKIRLTAQQFSSFVIHGRRLIGIKEEKRKKGERLKRSEENAVLLKCKASLTLSPVTRHSITSLSRYFLPRNISLQSISTAGFAASLRMARWADSATADPPPGTRWRPIAPFGSKALELASILAILILPSVDFGSYFRGYCPRAFGSPLEESRRNRVMEFSTTGKDFYPTWGVMQDADLQP